MTSSVLSEMDRHTDTFSFPGDSRDIFHFKGMHRSINSLNGQKSIPNNTHSDVDSDSDVSFDSAGKKKSFERLWVRFAEKTSMQGIPYIHNAKLKWAKVIWALLTLAAIAAMIAHLYYLIAQYYSWPKQTKISLGFSNLKIPDVTICNTNIIKKSVLSDYNGAEELKEVLDFVSTENLVPNDSGYDGTGGSGTNQPHGEPKVRRKRFVDRYREFNFTKYDYDPTKRQNSTLENDYDGEVESIEMIYDVFQSLYMELTKSVRAELGHNISSMLVSCTFNERTCSSDMFVLTQTLEYGNCWTISSNQFIARASGPSAGLQLILYMESQEYLTGITNGYGARLVIHSPNTYPFPWDEGLYISSAMETSIGLKMISIERQGQPYGDCDNGVSFYQLYGRTYSRQGCYAMCFLDMMLANCQCIAAGQEQLLVNNNTYQICHTTNETECSINVQQQYAKKDLPCTCHNPCSELQYEKSLSQRHWPSNDYAELLLLSVCQTNEAVCDALSSSDSYSLSQNFLKLNIYYEDLNFENITEEPEIEEAQFLSDIGGAIGLWIGLSVLALCEIFQLIFELCDYGVHKLQKSQMKRYQNKGEKHKRRNRERKLRQAHYGLPRPGFRTHQHIKRYYPRARPLNNFPAYKQDLRGDLSLKVPREDGFVY